MTDIQKKVTEAVEDMQKKVSRDSKHIYIDRETGIRLQGVSTVSSIVPKEWLAAWGAKEAVKALGYTDYEDLTVATEMLQKIKNCTTSFQYIKILKEAKGAHARRSKQAMLDGKLGHEWLEDASKARISGQAITPIPSGTLERPLTKVITWEQENIDYDICAESFVCNLARNYAGQLDKVCMLKTGELALIDYKFANHFSEEYQLQTAGYAACFEPYGIKIDKRIIIRLPKTLEKEEWNEKEHKYYMVPNDIEIKVIQSNYEFDRDAFYAALVVKAWINRVVGVDK